MNFLNTLFKLAEIGYLKSVDTKYLYTPKESQMKSQAI